MISYKNPVLPLLKNSGYNTSRLRREKLLGENCIQQLREGALISWKNLNRICTILHCQPGDLLQYTPDDESERD